jgi:hypothetical protein
MGNARSNEELTEQHASDPETLIRHYREDKTLPNIEVVPDAVKAAKISFNKHLKDINSLAVFTNLTRFVPTQLLT